MKTLVSTTHALATVDSSGVATLTIREAGTLNILSTPVILDLTNALNELVHAAEVRVLIISGSGDKAFVAGAFQREVLNIQKRKQNSPRSGQHVCTIELPRDSKFVPQVPQSQ